MLRLGTTTRVFRHWIQICALRLPSSCSLKELSKSKSVEKLWSMEVRERVAAQPFIAARGKCAYCGFPDRLPHADNARARKTGEEVWP